MCLRCASLSHMPNLRKDGRDVYLDKLRYDIATMPITGRICPLIKTVNRALLAPQAPQMSPIPRTGNCVSQLAGHCARYIFRKATPLLFELRKVQTYYTLYSQNRSCGTAGYEPLAYTDVQCTRSSRDCGMELKRGYKHRCITSK